MAPILVDRQSDSLTLQWQPVSFCGAPPTSTNHYSVHYVLEAAEGQEWRSGMSSRFVSDLSIISAAREEGVEANPNGEPYRLMCCGPCLTRVQVTDLKPATWFHWRLAIEYSGVRVVSDPRPYPTTRAVPSVVSKPRVHVIPGGQRLMSNNGLSEPKIHLTWVPPASNGSIIEKYHVQVKETEKKAKPKTIATRSQRGEGVLVQSKWQTVYCNRHHEVILDAPRAEVVVEWQIRVRAKNADGWSRFSSVRVINKHTHPSLFPAAFTCNNMLTLRYEDAPVSDDHEIHALIAHQGMDHSAVAEHPHTPIAATPKLTVVPVESGGGGLAPEEMQQVMELVSSLQLVTDEGHLETMYRKRKSTCMDIRNVTSPKKDLRYSVSNGLQKPPPGVSQDDATGAAVAKREKGSKALAEVTGQTRKHAAQAATPAGAGRLRSLDRDAATIKMSASTPSLSLQSKQQQQPQSQKQQQDSMQPSKTPQQRGKSAAPETSGGSPSSVIWRDQDLEDILLKEELSRYVYVFDWDSSD